MSIHFTKVKICKHCVCNFLGPQLVLAMERGPFHKGQYAVFVFKVSAVTKEFMRDSRPKIHTLILTTGAMTKSLCLEERPIIITSKGLTVP